MEVHFDFVIVGAGTAGCLLANRLSADPACRVLLLEAGPPDRNPWIHIPVGYLYCIGNPRTDWCFRTEAEPGLNGRALRYPRGRTLGGCSSINGMIYQRGQAEDYDGWARHTGDAAWSWANCLPDFIAHEDHHRRDADGDRAHDAAFAARHGHGGEWRVERQRLRWPILDAFAAAAQQAGIPASTDFSDSNEEGVGYFEVNQRRGWRWNTAKAFLRPVLQRRNLVVWTEAQATKLLLARDPASGGAGVLRCRGVQVLHRGQLLDVMAAREVLLSAGAVSSPQLLQLSGIGPAALLQQHGLPVLADLPGVGANLQDHLQIRAVFKVQGARTLNTLAATPWGQAAIALEYAVKRSGPMSMAPSQLGLFARSAPEKPRPDLQFHVQPLSLDAFGEPLHRFPAITASVCNLQPGSRGTVRIRSPRWQDAPAIAPNYLSTEADRHTAAQSLRLVRRIAAQPALAPHTPEEFRPGLQFQSDEELARLAGDIATTIFHPVGTTAMGHDGNPMAVLDPHLRVRDPACGPAGRVAGLRVVDAGAMPTITGGNTNSPTLMLAEKAARWVAAGV